MSRVVYPQAERLAAGSAQAAPPWRSRRRPPRPAERFRRLPSASQPAVAICCALTTDQSERSQARSAEATVQVTDVRRV